ncbi:hypothetical protein DPEC_G00208780 [Dallia pectoralis]|uniref:Uncharacterized protein n=1 Tax=Dallia pectoralis TaxID=75939 RepID=A0ACC2G5A5_DALPE|nr:hypothetical protein DPEC_G00208780 [Dallia pectoralis]
MMPPERARRHRQAGLHAQDRFKQLRRFSGSGGPNADRIETSRVGGYNADSLCTVVYHVSVVGAKDSGVRESERNKSERRDDWPRWEDEGRRTVERCAGEQKVGAGFQEPRLTRLVCVLAAGSRRQPRHGYRSGPVWEQSLIIVVRRDRIKVRTLKQKPGVLTPPPPLPYARTALAFLGVNATSITEHLFIYVTKHPQKHGTPSPAHFINRGIQRPCVSTSYQLSLRIGRGRLDAAAAPPTRTTYRCWCLSDFWHRAR